MRSTRFLVLLLLLLIAASLSTFLSRRSSFRSNIPPPPRPLAPTETEISFLTVNNSAPLQLSTDHIHPIQRLLHDAHSAWDKQIRGQSTSLRDAVDEYKRRYGLPPPPNFDKWFAFAKKRNVHLIDEYDTIYHSLLPFWALPPRTIRSRAREALGYDDNFLLPITIRDHEIQQTVDDGNWLTEALVGMTKSFIRYLPDMDLAFNTHDEPRVVVPHDELAGMVHRALEAAIPAVGLDGLVSNHFSSRPADLHPDPRMPEVKTTRFNEYPHQSTWLPSRMSCPLDSPARTLLELHAPDNLAQYALGDLGFIYNQTAFSDVCNSPSLSRSHGFFDRPNAFNIVHDLFPIFSQSKMSNFQDILFPSPWYWFGKVAYDEEKDVSWAEKQGRLWWRGSTTGGFSRDGGWKRQHRQQLVRKINAPDTARVYVHESAHEPRRWVLQDVPRRDFRNLTDVHFSHVGQCDPGDCGAQREFFEIVEPADQQDAWNYKYLLDIDGNAFSGRFYAFLRSRSLTFKMAVFREWHEEWIKPWLHYIPLSLHGDDALEAVRYFDQEEEGRHEAVRVAEASRDWAKKALRNEDLEVWLFRLLLEYARLIDDDRANIGFVP